MAVVGLCGKETMITRGAGDVFWTVSVRWVKKSLSSDSGTRITLAPAAPAHYVWMG